MSNDFGGRATPHNRYLLVPVMPTPNGRLHLGHISGPFLKTDVLARHLRRDGSKVRVISGSDGHESHVLLKAVQTGASPEEVCDVHHRAMATDLASLDIVYDCFINPLEARWNDAYTRINREVVEALVALGATVERPETYLWSPDSDRYIVGCWLSGRCPACRQRVGSFFCEACGTQFRPQDVLEATPLMPETRLESRETTTLYLSIADQHALLSRLQQMAVPADFIGVARAYLQREGGYVRLTNPGTWGVPWQRGKGGVPRVIFTYTALFGFSVLCGEVYAELEGTENPFGTGSNVATIATFGIDNAVPYLVGVVGEAMQHPTLRPFDIYLTNYFLSLEGAKFSTSRGHVIWAADFVRDTPLSSDATRFFLSCINPERAGGNFELDALVSCINERVRPIQAAALAALQAIPTNSPGSAASSLLAALEDLLGTQERSLNPESFHLAASVEPIERWLRLQSTYQGDALYWWTKGLALLVWPIMPRLGQALWQNLGASGEPSKASFLEPRTPTKVSEIVVEERVCRADLEPALPLTITRNSHGQ